MITQTDTDNIGLVGLGIIGSAIFKNIQDSKFNPIGFDIDQKIIEELSIGRGDGTETINARLRLHTLRYGGRRRRPGGLATMRVTPTTTTTITWAAASRRATMSLRRPRRGGGDVVGMGIASEAPKMAAVSASAAALRGSSSSKITMMQIDNVDNTKNNNATATKTCARIAQLSDKSLIGFADSSEQNNINYIICFI